MTTIRPVHVVIVAFHAADLLAQCLERLGGRWPVVVIDNSSDIMVRRVAENAGSDYVDSAGNRGFAFGVNVALATLLAGPPIDVLLLNPDAEIAGTDVVALSTRLHASGCERVGALSPTLVDVRGEPQRVMWPFPHPARAWVEAVGLGRLNRARDFAVGTCLLLRWEALHDVGPFDETFFLYAEETDWQRRARDLGWLADVTRDAVCRHVGGGTSTDADVRESYFHSGTETYVRKWHGTVGWASYRAAVMAGALARAVVSTGSRRRRAWRRARLYLNGPRRVAGLT